MEILIKHAYREIKKNFYDYLLLVTAGVFFICGISIFQGERLAEFTFLLFFVFFYIIWGIYHHSHQTGLHLKIVIEYILIGFLFTFLLKLVILP